MDRSRRLRGYTDAELHGAMQDAFAVVMTEEKHSLAIGAAERLEKLLAEFSRRHAQEIFGCTCELCFARWRRQSKARD